MGDDNKHQSQELHDRIRELAYLLWEAAGRRHGLSLDYWLAAETEVMVAMRNRSDNKNPSDTRPSEDRRSGAKPSTPEERRDTTVGVATAEAPGGSVRR